VTPIRVGGAPAPRGLFEPEPRAPGVETTGELEAILASLVTRAGRGERVGSEPGGRATELVHIERLPEREAIFGDLAKRPETCS